MQRIEKDNKSVENKKERVIEHWSSATVSAKSSTRVTSYSAPSASSNTVCPKLLPVAKASGTPLQYWCAATTQ
jgi:hypothetical protein